MLKKESTLTGSRSKDIYVNFSKGEVIVSSREGRATYSEISGYLKLIRLTNREFNGRKQKYWYIFLKDGSETYKIGFYYEDSSFKGVIMALRDKGIKGTDRLTFKPYLSGKYTNVDIYLNNESTPLRWSGTLPDIEEVTVGGNTYLDSTKRMQFIEAEAAKIVDNLKPLGYGK